MRGRAVPLPDELEELIIEHWAALRLQRRARRWRAMRAVRAVRRRWRVEGERRAVACMAAAFFELGAGREVDPMAAWGVDLAWWQRYEPSVVRLVCVTCERVGK